jgi:hypothetical protein
MASAQLAFPGAIDRAAEQLSDNIAAHAKVADAVDRAAVDRVAANEETAPTPPTPTCPYCDGGHCVVCGQSGFRLDYGACGPYCGGLAFDEPCYMTPAASVASGAPTSAASMPAPKAPEPDDSPLSAAESAEAPQVADADISDAPRSGILLTLSASLDRVAGAVSVRKSLSTGVVEASRAWEVTRQWLASRRPVATVEPAPKRNEATEKLYDWFASSKSPAIAAGETAAVTADASSVAHESASRPAVTKNVSPPKVAEIDSFVPAEAFAPLGGEKPREVDWEAAIAEAYLERVRAESAVTEADNERGTGDDFAAADLLPSKSADPRQDLLTPTIRTAAVALERLGHAALDLSSRLRTLTDGSVRR